MLYSVAAAIAAIATISLFVIGTAFLLIGYRILSGSSSSYDLNRSVSTSFRDTFWGRLPKDEVDGETRVMRGIGYRVKKGRITLEEQARLNRDALHEVSEKSE